LADEVGVSLALDELSGAIKTYYGEDVKEMKFDAGSIDVEPGESLDVFVRRLNRELREKVWENTDEYSVRAKLEPSGDRLSVILLDEEAGMINVSLLKNPESGNWEPEEKFDRYKGGYADAPYTAALFGIRIAKNLRKDKMRENAVREITYPSSEEDFAERAKANPSKYMNVDFHGDKTVLSITLSDSHDVQHSRIQHFVGPGAAFEVKDPEASLLKSGGKEYTWQDGTWKDGEGVRLLVKAGKTVVEVSKREFTNS